MKNHIKAPVYGAFFNCKHFVKTTKKGLTNPPKLRPLRGPLKKRSYPFTTGNPNYILEVSYD